MRSKIVLVLMMSIFFSGCSTEEEKWLSKHNSTGVFADFETKLIWQDNSDAKIVRKVWSGAKAYCETLEFAGSKLWHLPTKKELAGLYIKKNSLLNVNSAYYWSTTTRASSKGYAWSMDYSDGHGGYYLNTNYVYVRCVR